MPLPLPRPRAHVVCAFLVVLLAACQRDQPVAPMPLESYGAGGKSTAGQLSLTPELRVAYRVPTESERREAAAIQSRRGAAKISSAATTESVSRFDHFIRYPAEVRNWWVMDGDSAYFRDVFVGGSTTIVDAQDGDTWTAEAVVPGSSAPYAWPTIRFYASYNGQSNCFVTTGWYICDTRWLFVQWYRSVLCNEVGLWTMRFLHNGEPFHEGQFRVLPKLEGGRVSLVNQLSYATTLYDHSCRKPGTKDAYVCADTEPDHQTIKQVGCAISSATMILNYHGVPTTVTELNDYLRDNDGYSGAGSTDWSVVAEFASQKTGKTFLYKGKSVGSDEELRNLICKYGPQALHVKNRAHFVAATGWDEERKTFLINDPNGGVAITMNEPGPRWKYNNVINSIRWIIGPEYAYTDDRSGITVFFHSPGQITLADPSGRRVGYDPRQNRSYAEVPRASYDSTALEDLSEPEIRPEYVKMVQVDEPVNGEYTVTVVGTGTGTYRLDIRKYGVALGQRGSTVFPDVPIAPGEVHSYQFAYDKANASGPVVVTGGFLGGGQRDDVDGLLTYVAPAERQTTLAPGARTYGLMIVYAANINPAAFTAELNGIDVSTKFHPRPGTLETVRLDLQSGRNVLKLGVTGTVRGKSAADKDQLVFHVP